MNSVNTNMGAMVALKSLNITNSEMEATQKRISTGFRVADAVDDGAAFAVAQRVRGDVAALTSANKQMDNAKGLLDTSKTSLEGISNVLVAAKGLLGKIADASIPDGDRDQAVIKYKELVVQVANYTDNSAYNGQTLLGKTAGAVAGTAKSVINNEVGATTTLSAADVSGLASTMATLIGATFSRTAPGVDTFTAGTAAAAQTAASTALSTTTGATSFADAQKGVLDKLNQNGADTNLLTASIKFNSAKIGSLNAGMGALIDADLSQEAANLQSLQIRQQLGTQSLSMANQAPQALLSLFR